MLIILPSHIVCHEKRAALIKYINKQINKSVTHWERYCDGKVPETQRKFHHERYQELTDEVEEILNALGIKVEWPGLWGSFSVGGIVYHSMESAVNEVFKIRAP
jgi:hypothetical protein